ncbi:MAG: mercuric reductase [Thermoanaerobaculia bacterium]|nr:mercuric reductase [Thermoanaerobaculia bacterium]
MERYDGIIIGTGQAGKPLAHALAEAGWRTAIVERRLVGGSCINYGCTPTKTMVASARVAHLARRAAEYGVSTGSIAVDLEIVRQRKRSIVERFRDSGREGLEEAENLDLVMGEARFVDDHEIEIVLADGRTKRLAGDQIFINTGTRPLRPPIDGLEAVEALDNESIMELPEVPEYLVVVGGGYVGLEFAQMFGRFGSTVTVVQRCEQLLPREDPDIADAVREILEEEGIEVLLESEAQSVEPRDGSIRVTVQGSEGERRLEASHLLLAAGRRPNTDALDLEKTAVETDEKGFVRVNDRLETTAAGVYALGDVKGGPAFTHISYDDFRVVRGNLLEGADASIDGRLVPYTVFIDPQLGRVGSTEKEARSEGVDVRVARLPMSSVARALETDETQGLIKAVVDAESDRILGVAILGIEGGELMAVVQVAMMGDLPYTALRDGIFAHPTLAEALNNLFAGLE